MFDSNIQANLVKGRTSTGRIVGDFLKLVIDFGNELFSIKSVVILNLVSNSYSVSYIFIFLPNDLTFFFYFGDFPPFLIFVFIGDGDFLSICGSKLFFLE
jgi:hypothetical protein